LANARNRAVSTLPFVYFDYENFNNMTTFPVPTTEASPSGETDVAGRFQPGCGANAGGLPPIALRALLARIRRHHQAGVEPQSARLASIAGEKAAYAVLARRHLGTRLLPNECLAPRLSGRRSRQHSSSRLRFPRVPRGRSDHAPDPTTTASIFKGTAGPAPGPWTVAIRPAAGAQRRRVTDDGARRFAQALSDGGLAIVVGSRVGYRCAAHREGAAVPAARLCIHGTGRISSPPLHPLAGARDCRRTARRFTEWTHCHFGTPARPANFPQRNVDRRGWRAAAGLSNPAMRLGVR